MSNVKKLTSSGKHASYFAHLASRKHGSKKSTNTKVLGNEETTFPADDEEEKTVSRSEWGNKMDFMMSCIGFAVGLGNIWRFPYLCYKNGGGAFLIPYLICLVFSGVPVFLLETALGQLLGRGFISIWAICPILKGVGYSSLILVFWLDSYYITIVTWSAYYFLKSFSFGELPWASCNHTWSSPNCFADGDFENTCWHLQKNQNNIKSEVLSKLTAEELAACKNFTSKFGSSSVKDFWNLHVLQTTASIETSGGVIWYLWALLGLMWLLCYWAMYKGIKTTGKIVYVTALFPYFCLFFLFIRGVTLDGALDGIIFYLKPDLNRLLEPTVWNDAATQIFFSYGLGVGAWIALSSYNTFNNDVLKDTIIISVINAFTAIFSGSIVFSIIGFMAHQAGVSVSEVAESGSGLSFIVYPSATLKMPFAQFWSVLFFAMMLMLGMGSQFVQLESLFTGIIDEFPDVLAKRRPLFIGLASLLSFAAGLALVSRGGIYWFTLFDTNAASGFSLLYLIFFQTVAISWFYGTDTFVKQIEFMLDKKVSVFWVICWKYVSPLLTMSIFIFNLVQYEPVKYIDYNFPPWSIAFGWFLALSSMLAVPVYAMGKFALTPGTFVERWNALVKPNVAEIESIIRNRADTVESHRGRWPILKVQT